VDHWNKSFVTDDLFMVLGGDFRWMNAYQNYENFDNLISYLNEHYGDKYFFRYSTPSDYIDAVARHNVSWPIKTDDMFPYSDAPDSFWTGYFTSRPNLKEYVRRGSHSFHASAQLYSEKLLSQALDPDAKQAILNTTHHFMDVLGVS
jgi:hypothetical protein